MRPAPPADTAGQEAGTVTGAVAAEPQPAAPVLVRGREEGLIVVRMVKGIETSTGGLNIEIPKIRGDAGELRVRVLGHQGEV